MAKFDFFGLFKKKKTDVSEKVISIDEMSFSELFEEYNELINKRAKLDLTKKDELEKIDAEIKKLYEKLLKCFADKNNEEAQAFINDKVNIYIEASKQKAKIRKRVEEIRQDTTRYNYLRVKMKLDIEPVSQEEQAEFEMLEATRKQSREELNFLIRKENECDLKITAADMVFTRFRISSQKLEDFKAAEIAERVAERKKRMAEREDKMKHGAHGQSSDGHQPGEE